MTSGSEIAPYNFYKIVESLPHQEIKSRPIYFNPLAKLSVLHIDILILIRGKRIISSFFIFFILIGKKPFKKHILEKKE